MLKKLLNNPFGLKLTEVSKAFVWMGMLSSLILHIAFYFTIVHFIIKFW